MAVSSRRYTAFSTPDGAAYEFWVMPFGLAGAPGTFQRLMLNVLEGYVHAFVKVYLDDLVIYSDTYDQHLHHVELVLELLWAHGLVCALDKCKVAVTHIEYLGHIITDTSNLPQPRHMEKIKDFPPPRNVRELRGFIGTHTD